MKGIRRTMLVGFLLIAGAVALSASTRSSLDNKLHLDLAKVQAGDVFASFASILGCSVDLDPAVDGPVTIQLKQVSARTVLTALCEMVDCDWTLEDESADGDNCKLTIRSRADREEESRAPGDLATPITMSLVAAPIDQVLEAFASLLGAQLEFDRGATVTVELADIPVGHALDLVCSQIGCDWELDESGASRRLAVRMLDGE